MTQSNHNGSLFETYRRLISLGVIPFFWGLLSLAPSKASADAIDTTTATTQTADDANTGHSVTLKSGTTPANVTPVTPDNGEPVPDSTDAPTTAESLPNQESTTDTTTSEGPTASPEKKTASPAVADSNQPETNAVKSSAAQPVARSAKTPSTANTITNTASSAPATQLTDEQLDQVSAAVSASLQQFNDSNGSDYQLTGVTNIGKRAVATVTATNVTNPYAALIALNSAVVNDDRLFYLKNIAGQQLQLYFNYNGSLVSSVLSIPVAVQAVASDGTVLQQATSLLDTAGHALLPGGSWTTTAPTIPGYTLIDQPTNANGSWDATFDYDQLSADDQLLVTYRYQVTPQYAQVVFVDDSNNQVIQTVTLTGVLGETSPYDPAEVAKSLAGNYQLVGSDIPSDGITYNTDGTIISYRVHLTPVKTTTELDDDPSLPNSTTTHTATTTPNTDVETTTSPDIVSQPETNQLVANAPAVSIPETPVDSPVPALLDHPATTTTTLMSNPQLDTSISADLTLLSVPVLTLQDPFTLIGRAVGIAVNGLTITEASAKTSSEDPSEAQAGHVSSLDSQPTASTTYFTDESVTLTDNTVHFTSQHRHRNRTDASSDSILQLFPHPDMIKEPGGGATHTQLGKYLSSIGGTINFGTTAAESETIPISEL